MRNHLSSSSLLFLPPAAQEDQPRLRGLAGCYALFQYLTTGVQAADDVFSKTREKLEELHRTSTPDSSQLGLRLAAECEALAVQQAALLRYHSSVGVFSLATLRSTLTCALSTWPGCAPLWSLYLQVSPLIFY